MFGFSHNKYTGWHFDCGVFLICLALTLLAGLILVAGPYEFIQQRRSFVAQTECLKQRMVPVRQDFSSTVVCVPNANRQDTTTVQVR